jgi:septal ring factor EnvC (AmiA/AmiB activator)
MPNKGHSFAPELPPKKSSERKGTSDSVERAATTSPSCRRFITMESGEKNRNRSRSRDKNIDVEVQSFTAMHTQHRYLTRTINSLETNLEESRSQLQAREKEFIELKNIITTLTVDKNRL